MTTEEKQFWTAVATAIFDIAMVLPAFTFAAEYKEVLLAVAAVVSILASSFLGVSLQKPMSVAREQRIENKNKP
jgi:uncharacterized membrane protein